jgi:hypothetical protein
MAIDGTCRSLSVLELCLCLEGELLICLDGPVAGPERKGEDAMSALQPVLIVGAIIFVLNAVGSFIEFNNRFVIIRHHPVWGPRPKAANASRFHILRPLG